MYRRRNNGQISIAEFHLPFGGTLDPANRWIKLEELMPWEELEEAYARNSMPPLARLPSP